MSELSLHHPTLLTASAEELVETAAATGYRYVGLRAEAPDPGGAAIDVVGDIGERRRLQRALAATGVGLLDLEALWLRPETDPRSLVGLIDVAAELGARAVLTVGYDQEPARLADTVGALARSAGDAGVLIALESITYSAVPDLETASSILADVGEPALRILIDSLQFFRAATDLDDLAAVDASLLPYIQVSDAPAESPGSVDARRHEARHARLQPGDGELDLVGLLAALPADIPIAVEVPNETYATRDRVELAGSLAAATRRVIAAATVARGAR